MLSNKKWNQTEIQDDFVGWSYAFGLVVLTLIPIIFLGVEVIVSFVSSSSRAPDLCLKRLLG